MKYPKLEIRPIAVCLILLAATFMNCSRATDTIETSDAIEIARSKVTSDGIMTLVDRDEVAVDEGENWHVYFPFQDVELLGGEPHVIISKSDGTVVETYYTQ